MVEPTQFRVVITGLILLTAQELYYKKNADTIGAALAISVEERNGSYDVEIPDHEARLVVEMDEFSTDPADKNKLLIKGTDKDRITKIDPDAKKPHPRVVALNGDRVRFGQYKTGVSPECVPFASDEAADAKSGSLKYVPRFSQLGVKKVILRDDSKPTLKKDSKSPLFDFEDVSRKRLAAWLELSGGRLKIKRTGKNEQDLSMAEFRPSRHSQRIAPAVVWRRETEEDRRGCIIVDPFKDDDPGEKKPDVVLFLKSNKVKVVYQNMPDNETGEDHELAAYDFEMFYRVLRKAPPVPPVPYYVSQGAMMHKTRNGEVGTLGTFSGVNCGPARIP